MHFGGVRALRNSKNDEMQGFIAILYERFVTNSFMDKTGRLPG